MEMLVETYEVNEIDAHGKVECDSEAVELIDQLGLSGQRRLISDDGDSPQRLPYPKMTLEQKRVIKAICAEESAIGDYTDQIIPLRVLQVAAHAKDLFDELLVWYPKNADEKDPYLIGLNRPREYAKDFFILARWGEELLAWDELKSKAVCKIRELRKSAMLKIRQEVEAALAVIDEMPGEGVLKESESPSLSDYYHG